MPRHGVQCISNEEPSFIKQFKQRIGYKDGPDVNTKRNFENRVDDDEEEDTIEKDDEKPLIVVVKPGDLTAEEAQVEQKQIEEGPANLDEKITFKKPIKKSKEPEESSTSAQPEKVNKRKQDTRQKGESNSKKIKNSSLLSFSCEDEEEG